MNDKLLEFAVEQLHRDPDLLDQETKTAINKFFSSRKNVDELISLIRGGSPTERADLNRIILSLQINECKLQKQILILENEISRLKRAKTFKRIDEEYIKPEPKIKKSQNNNEIKNETRPSNETNNTKNAKGPKAPVEKKVKVWTRGVRAD